MLKLITELSLLTLLAYVVTELSYIPQEIRLIKKDIRKAARSDNSKAA